MPAVKREQLRATDEHRYLIAVGGWRVQGHSPADVLQRMQQLQRPLWLTFETGTAADMAAAPPLSLDRYWLSHAPPAAGGAAADAAISCASGAPLSRAPLSPVTPSRQLTAQACTSPDNRGSHTCKRGAPRSPSPDYTAPQRRRTAPPDTERGVACRPRLRCCHMPLQSRAVGAAAAKPGRSRALPRTAQASRARIGEQRGSRKLGGSPRRPQRRGGGMGHAAAAAVATSPAAAAQASANAIAERVRKAELAAEASANNYTNARLAVLDSVRPSQQEATSAADLYQQACKVHKELPNREGRNHLETELRYVFDVERVHAFVVKATEGAVVAGCGSRGSRRLQNSMSTCTPCVLNFRTRVYAAAAQQREQHETIEAQLVEVLQACRGFEAAEQTAWREHAVSDLAAMAQRWSQDLGRLNGMSEEQAAQVATLRTFGSYRLGVHTPDADIDCLLLCPRHCTCQDFFGSFCTDYLAALADVTDVVAVSEAYTPVLKFKMRGVPVDLLFCSLQYAQLPQPLDVQEDRHLSGLDEASVHVCNVRASEAGGASPLHVRSLNGVRVAELILRVMKCRACAACAHQSQEDRHLCSLDEASVRSLDGVRVAELNLQVVTCRACAVCAHQKQEERHLSDFDAEHVRSLDGVRVAELILQLVPNVDTFRMVLRAVKEWARRRGIYSNVLGCLGGINWKFPNAAPSTVLHRLFRCYVRWEWPTPVLITPTRHEPAAGCAQLTVWNPRVNVHDRAHIMPIITPAYPAMNSSYNVGKPQLRLLKEEFARGLEVTELLDDQPQHGHWRLFFEKSDFFYRFLHYIQVDVLLANPEDHRCWLGFVESRMRRMTLALERPPVLAHPYANIISRRVADAPGPPQLCTSFFIGLSIKSAHAITPRAPRSPVPQLNLWERRTPTMDLRLWYRRCDELPAFIYEHIPRAVDDAYNPPAAAAANAPAAAPQHDESAAMEMEAAAIAAAAIAADHGMAVEEAESGAAAPAVPPMAAELPGGGGIAAAGDGVDNMDTEHDGPAAMEIEPATFTAAIDAAYRQMIARRANSGAAMPDARPMAVELPGGAGIAAAGGGVEAMEMELDGPAAKVTDPAAIAAAIVAAYHQVTAERGSTSGAAAAPAATLMLVEEPAAASTTAAGNAADDLEMEVSDAAAPLRSELAVHDAGIAATALAQAAPTPDTQAPGPARAEVQPGPATINKAGGRGADVIEDGSTQASPHKKPRTESVGFDAKLQVPHAAAPLRTETAAHDAGVAATAPADALPMAEAQTLGSASEEGQPGSATIGSASDDANEERSAQVSHTVPSLPAEPGVYDASVAATTISRATPAPDAQTPAIEHAKRQFGPATGGSAGDDDANGGSAKASYKKQKTSTTSAKPFGEADDVTQGPAAAAPVAQVNSKAGLPEAAVETPGDSTITEACTEEKASSKALPKKRKMDTGGAKPSAEPTNEAGKAAEGTSEVAASAEADLTAGATEAAVEVLNDDQSDAASTKEKAPALEVS
ncbi:Poly(A) polymerase central domain-containing protein [Tribonema minus]|uniref:polynucleotide adenylyltransferase n=1 Tax=Tribonema minus TaxID=303371 RepID=A0A835ZBJ4_9STRA|nr:Poly(A) polymerase central domain-containing protein [Tribonema minus]